MANGPYDFRSPGAAAGAAILDVLTRRREEERQRMLDEITRRQAEAQIASAETQQQAAQQAMLFAQLSQLQQHPGTYDSSKLSPELRGAAEQYNILGQRPVPPTPQVSTQEAFVVPPAFPETTQDVVGYPTEAYLPMAPDVPPAEPPVEPTMESFIRPTLEQQQTQEQLEEAEAIQQIQERLGAASTEEAKRTIALELAARVPGMVPLAQQFEPYGRGFVLPAGGITPKEIPGFRGERGGPDILSQQPYAPAAYYEPYDPTGLAGNFDSKGRPVTRDVKTGVPVVYDEDTKKMVPAEGPYTKLGVVRPIDTASINNYAEAVTEYVYATQGRDRRGFLSGIKPEVVQAARAKVDTLTEGLGIKLGASRRIQQIVKEVMTDPDALYVDPDVYIEQLENAGVALDDAEKDTLSSWLRLVQPSIRIAPTHRTPAAAPIQFEAPTFRGAAGIGPTPGK